MAQLDTEATVCINVEDEDGNTTPHYYQYLWLSELMTPDLEVDCELG